MENLNLQFLQLELNRVSEWIKFSDKKTAFLSVFYSAIFGLVFSQKEQILQYFLIFQWTTYFYVLILLGLTVSFFVGIFFLFRSIFPRLKNSFTDKSLLYYGHVANMKFLDYSEAMGRLTDDDARKQIIEQIYTNSIIAEQKMRNVQNSLKSLIVLMFIVVILVFL